VVEYIRYVLNHIFDLTQKATIYIELLFQLHTQSYAIASHLSCVVWVLKVMRACTCQMVSIAIASFFNKYYCILKNKSNDMRIQKIFLFQVLPDCKYFIYHPLVCLNIALTLARAPNQATKLRLVRLALNACGLSGIGWI
jgi:hypothetical protein